MQPVPVSVLSPAARIRPRTALVASADRSFRQRLSEILTGLRWQVREAEGGPKPGLKPRPPLRRRSSSTPGCPISIWPSFSPTFASVFLKWTW